METAHVKYTQHFEVPTAVEEQSQRQLWHVAAQPSHIYNNDKFVCVVATCLH